MDSTTEDKKEKMVYSIPSNDGHNKLLIEFDFEERNSEAEVRIGVSVHEALADEAGTVEKEKHYTVLNKKDLFEAMFTFAPDEWKEKMLDYSSVSRPATQFVKEIVLDPDKAIEVANACKSDEKPMVLKIPFVFDNELISSIIKAREEEAAKAPESETEEGKDEDKAVDDSDVTE